MTNYSKLRLGHSLVSIPDAELTFTPSRSLIPEDTNDTEMQAKGVQPTNSACATEVNSLQQCFKLLRGSLAKRAVRFHGSRCMSRSHVIVTLQVEQLGAGSGKIHIYTLKTVISEVIFTLGWSFRAINAGKTGKLTMVDLAGYGEEDKELFTDPVAQLEEKSINLSNNSLTNAVTTLTDHKGEAWMMGQHRNKLTRLLKDCLGSKRCRTTLLAHVDDSLATFHDTASTLFFASKAAEVHGSVSSGYPLTPESVSKLEAKTRTVTSLQNAVDYKSLELEQAQRAHAEAAAQRDALRTDLAQLTNHNQSGSPVSSGSHSSLKDIKIQTTPSLSKAIKEGDIDSAYKEAKKQMEIKLKDFSHQQGSDSNLEKLKQEWSQQLGILRQQLQEEIQRVKEDSAEQVAKQLDYSLKESNTDLNNDRNALEKQLQEAQREVLRQERKVEEMKASLYERQTELEEQLQQSNELREKEVALAHLEQTEAWCDVIDTRLKQREERMNALIEQYEADLKLQDADHLDYQRSALQSQCHQLDHFARRIVEHASTVVEENDRLRDEYENTVNGLRAATSEEIQRIRQEEQWKAQQELQKAVAVAAQQAQWNGFEKSMDIVQRSTDNAIGLLRTKGTWHEECHKHPHQTSSDRVHQEKYVRSARGNASSGNSFQERGLSYRKNDLGSSAKNGDNKKSHHKHSRNIPLPPVYDGAVSDSEGDTSAKDLRKHEKSGQRRPLQRDVDKSVETDSSFIPENGRDEDTDISSSLITDNDSGFEDINKYNSARNQEVASRNPNPNPNRKRKRENGVRNTSGSRVDQRRKKVKSSESDASLEGAWARGIVNQQTQKPTGILKKKIESSSSAGNQKERPVEHSNATISTKGSKSSKKSQGRTLQSAFGRSKESPAAEQKHTSSIPEVSFEGKSSATEQDDELFEDWENTKRNVSKKNSISATNNKNKTHHQQQKSKSKQTSAAAPVNDSVSVDSGKNHQTNESNNDTEERGGSIFSANDIKEMQQTSQQKKSKKLAGRRTALLDLENSIESRQSPRALLQNRLKHTEKVPAADKENSRDSSFSSSVKTGGASTSVASIGMTTGLAMGMHSFGPHGGFKVPKLKKSSTAGLKKSEASSSSSSSGSRRL